MEIQEVTENKKEHLALLLLADESESMIDRYLDRGDMFALNDNDGTQAICVVTDEGDGVFELKNISVEPDKQRKGYGSMLVQYICERYAPRGSTLVVGTGDSPLTMPFYQGLGFQEFRREPEFFIKNYDHPMFECGKQLIDMVYLKRDL